jgi:hypothetical protein
MTDIIFDPNQRFGAKFQKLTVNEITPLFAQIDFSSRFRPTCVLFDPRVAWQNLSEE